MKSYLIMMAVRLIEMRRILKATGSLYLHCDPTASHYIKLFMDAIFGSGSFRSEVIWQRTSAHPSARRWASTYDSLLFYTKSEKYKWNRIYQAPDKNYVRTHYIYEDDKGRYRASDLTGPGVSRGASGHIWRGFDPNEKGRHWAYVPDTLDEMDKQGLIHWPSKPNGWPAKKVYWDDTRRDVRFTLYGLTYRPLTPRPVNAWVIQPKSHSLCWIGSSKPVRMKAMWC